MSSLPATTSNAEAIERVVVGGDLSKLSAEDRVGYYKMVCESVGLNPLTKPFEYITLNGKLTLYARKDATDQLRNNNQVSITIQAREFTEGCYVVTARATLPNGRTDESIGAVPIDKVSGEARANAMMKTETKAKRRVTLSICGLGMLDETEIETIPSAKPEVTRTTSPIPIAARPIQDAEPTPVTLGGTQAEAPSREPGSDDDVEECIDLPRQRALHRAAKDAAPVGLKPAEVEIAFRFWLKTEGYSDPETLDGSTKRIPLALFDEVKRNAVKYMSGLK